MCISLGSLEMAVSVRELRQPSILHRIVTMTSLDTVDNSSAVVTAASQRPSKVYTSALMKLNWMADSAQNDAEPSVDVSGC